MILIIRGIPTIAVASMIASQPLARNSFRCLGSCSTIKQTTEQRISMHVCPFVCVTRMHRVIQCQLHTTAQYQQQTPRSRQDAGLGCINPYSRTHVMHTMVRYGRRKPLRAVLA